MPETAVNAYSVGIHKFHSGDTVKRFMICAVAAAFLSGCAPYQPKPVFDPTPSTELAPEMAMSSLIVARMTGLRVVHADLPRAFPGLTPKDLEAPGGASFSFTVDEKGAVKDIQLLQASAPSIGDEYRTYIAHWQFEPVKQDGAPSRVHKQVRFTIQPKALDESTTQVDPGNGIAYQGKSIASRNLQLQITAAHEVLFKPLTGCARIDRIERQFMGAYRPIKFNEAGIAVTGEAQERWLARGCGKAFIAYVWYAFTPDGKTNHALSTTPRRVSAIVKPPTIQ